MTTACSSPAHALALDRHRQLVRSRYAAIAGGTDTDPSASTPCGCGGSGCCADPTNRPENCRLSHPLPSRSGQRPPDATLPASTDLTDSATEQATCAAGSDLGLGCGNPFAFANLKPGETVLDLGSGTGFDAFIAARVLNGKGHVIGVDMTPEMVSRARQNAVASGHYNVEFRLGEIEALPIADASIDLIIANCVINLSPDKPAVYREAFRVLRRGGRLSISDIVARGPLPEARRGATEKLTCCIGSAETVDQTTHWLYEAGFIDVRITTKDEARTLIATWAQPTEVKSLGELLVSSIIEARKP